MAIGAFTAEDVILTMRPNFRSIMPSTVALIRKMPVSMLPSTALIQSSRSQSRKSPGGGPPALLIRISGSGQAASRAARPSSVVTSTATGVTLTPVAARICSAVAFKASALRPLMTRSTPSFAKAKAQARPNPLEEAHTIAFRPLSPKSILKSPSCYPLFFRGGLYISQIN